MIKTDKNIEAIYPLTPMQQGMLFHTLLSPKSGVYFNQRVMTLTGSLQEVVLQRAWQAVLHRHESLRTLFVWEGQEKPLQVVLRKVALPWLELDWRGLSAKEQTVKLEELLRADRQRGFDLTEAPLMRFTLIRIEEARYELLWSQHHLLIDGWSGYLVLNEVVATYQAIAHGRECTLDPSYPYRAYANWLLRQDPSRAEGFWRAALKGFTAPTPLWRNRINEGRADQVCEAAVQVGTPSTSLLAALRTFGRRHDLTLSTLIHAAWALLLSRYSGERDVMFGSVVSGRPPELPGIESMVGLFINTLPVRAQFSSQDLVLGWLKRFQSQLVELRQYEYSSLVEVKGWSEVRSDQPLFESLLVFENYPVDAFVFGQEKGLKICKMQGFEQTNFPLTVAVIPRKELAIQVHYDARQFDAAAVTRLLGHLNTLLEGIVANPDQRLSDLPLLTSAERHQLLVEWNQTQQDYPRNKCIHELFEEQVERMPEAIAVVFEDTRLTYRQLNERANQLAHRLQELGVGPETLVGICVERSLEMVVGLLGILKAGGAYVPLDPAYPKDRLAFMLKDTKVPVVLTQQSLVEDLRGHSPRVICLDTSWGEIAECSKENPACLSVAENLAYVVYTSGSTGSPKGAAIPHRGVLRLLCGTDYARLDQSRIFLQLAPVSFDASTLEIWGPLLHGGRCVVFPDRVPSPEDLGRVLKEHHITTLWLTSSLFNAVIDQAPQALSSLDELLIGGEALSIPHVRRGLELLPDTQIINGYGPTESTTFTCCYRIPRDLDSNLRSVPIGRPIANTRVYILDERLKPVPVGVAGDLYIGGDGLARGYLNQPELTAEKFIPDPFSTEPGARLYRTGDVVRYLSDGNIEYLGRMDHQVKVRGFRIELGEIESVLAGLPGVREAVVVAREDVPGDKRLVAYVTTKQGESPKTSELRGLLVATLPEYMIPSVFVTLDRFPLTPNGKVDRKVLPCPDGQSEAPGLVPPTSATEKALAGIWSELLRIKQVGLHDNFFELGGHSLVAMRAASRASAVFRVEVPLRMLFEQPTVAGLARAIDTILWARAQNHQPKPCSTAAFVEGQI